MNGIGHHTRCVACRIAYSNRTGLKDEFGIITRHLHTTNTVAGISDVVLDGSSFFYAAISDGKRSEITTGSLLVNLHEYSGERTVNRMVIQVQRTIDNCSRGIIQLGCNRNIIEHRNRHCFAQRVDIRPCIVKCREILRSVLCCYRCHILSIVRIVGSRSRYVW